MAFRGTPQQAAEAAISSIGLGYDVSTDIRLTSCKSGSRLIDLGNDATWQIVLPGGISIANVPRSIKVDKGERVRYTSDVLSFQQMAEKFNQDLSLSGKIPSGLFNCMFEFSGAWQKDASSTKSLAFDGWFITLYTVALSQSQIALCDHVKKAVPSSWDPLALSRFIKEFGTHVIVSIKMGGKDVIYLRQQHSSSLQPAEFQNRLKEIADESFLDVNGQRGETCKKDNVEAREQRLRFIDFNSSSSYTSKEDIMKLPKRRGGIDKAFSHFEWLQTVQSRPDVISMSFVPITSLLSGVPGSGFLSHAINLYLRYKPRLEELHQFLEFQLPRQWAPVFSDLPLGPQRRPQSSSSLPFNFMGPKLYVNTSMIMIPLENVEFSLAMHLPVSYRTIDSSGKQQSLSENDVDVDRKPVTGIRLYLEGKSGNRLAIHLQHLSSLPQILKLEKDTDDNFNLETIDRRYYVPIQWKHLSHVCTAPIESDNEQSIVTGAQLQVAYVGFKKVLFLRLYFSKARDMLYVRSDWDGSTRLTQKSGLISTLISTHFSSAMQKPPRPCPEDVNINSALYPGGPPMSVQAPRLLKLIDTTEMSRGPQDSPGYWMVSGAKLHVERGKISLRVKFSHLTAILLDDEECI